MQEFYVGHLDDLPQNAENKAEALELYSLSKNYLWNPSLNGYGSLGYIVTAEGYKCYFINKDGLPENIRKNIKGGNAGNGTYFDYAEMNDVYGVTSDLRVYYCPDGQNTILKIALKDLDKDNPDKGVFSNNSENATELQKAMYGFLIKYDTDDDGILSAREIKAVTSLTITPEDKINSFSEFYYLTNLSTLKLQNLNIENLDGLSTLPLLSELTFEDCTVGNYDDLSGNLNLTFLCFIFRNKEIDSNTEIKKLCGTNGDNHLGISKTDFNKLNRLAITGSMANDGFTINIDDLKSNFSDLSPLSNLSAITKNSIKKLNLQNNSFKTINYLDGFSSLNYLNIGYNDYIESLDGIDKCKDLETLYGYKHGINFGKNEGNSLDDENNTLYDLQFCKKLKRFDFASAENSLVKYFSYIKNLESLEYFRFEGKNIDIDDLKTIKEFLKGLMEGYVINTIYNILMLDSDTTELSLAKTSIEQSVFETLSDYKNLIKLNIEYIEITNNGVEISDDDYNTLINSVLSKMSQLERLDICHVKISTIDFVYDKTSKKVNTPNLRVLHSLGTNVVDYTNLNYLSNLRTLAIDNTGIDLVSIQDTLSKCVNGTSYNHGFSSLYIGSLGLAKKLENCTVLTSLCLICGNWKVDWRNETLNLSNLINLKTVKLNGVNLKKLTLPSSVTELSILDVSSFPDLSTLSKLSSLEYRKGGGWDLSTTSNVINSLSSKVLNNEVSTKIVLNGLNDLTNLSCLNNKYNCSTFSIQNCNSLSNLTGISSMNNITELNCTNDTSLVNITGLSSLTQMTKLTLNKCGITNLSELKNLTNLNYIDLKNNPLADKEGEIDNIAILVGLRKSKDSLELYLSGCGNIFKWSEFAQFKSWWHDEEKAGY